MKRREFIKNSAVLTAASYLPIAKSSIHDQPAISLNGNEIILDKIDINYVTIDNTEKINICMTLNIYQNYEDRLLRINCIDTLHFISIQDSINKSIPESLWNKCYIKIKELLIDQNTQNIKISLNLSDSENISSQHQYLLEIDDHFN